MQRDAKEREGGQKEKRLKERIEEDEKGQQIKEKRPLSLVLLSPQRDTTC